VPASATSTLSCLVLSLLFIDAYRYGLLLGYQIFRSRFYRVPVAVFTVADFTYGGCPNFRCPLPFTAWIMRYGVRRKSEVLIEAEDGTCL